MGVTVPGMGFHKVQVAIDKMATGCTGVLLVFKDKESAEKWGGDVPLLYLSEPTDHDTGEEEPSRTEDDGPSIPR